MIPEEALLMAEAHLAVLPIGPGTKHPPFDEWQNQATDAVDVLEGWWDSHPRWGVGWKMGLQPDGRWLFAIDVDVNKGGKSSMQDLVREFGLQAELAGTVTARTGGGGFHFVFELPPDPLVVPTNRSKLRPGIDVRSEGGQIVVAPTIHPDSGLAYGWVDGKAPWQIMPSVASPGLMTMLGALLAPPPPLRLVTDLDTSIARHPSAQDWETPADFVRLRFDWWSYLVKHGWVHVDRESWRRPGKTDRGTSAELKNAGQGPLNVFTTEIPPALERLGKLDRTGQCVSITLFDFIAAYEFGGDRSACASWVRREHMTPAVPARTGGPDRDLESGGRAASPVPVGDVTPTLFLPDDFWSSTVLLSEVRRQALTRLRTPDAVLAALLTMYATTIPMNVWLPGVVGAQAPLNLFAVVVGRSGGGKTSAMTIAAQLMGSPGNKDILLRKQLRSGEGLITLVNKPGRKGSKTEDEVPPSTNVGVHVHYDEGGALSRQTNQTASTTIPYLNTAWSGAGTVGGALRDGDHGFDASRVRICALIGVQYGIGANLFTGEAATLGFPQRLLFLSADDHPAIQDQEMPDEIIEPEPFGLPFLRHADFVKPTFVDVPKPIRQEVWDWSKQIPDTYEGHAMNLRLRIATVLMLMHGAGDSDFTPWWNLSSLVINTHRDVRHAFVASIGRLNAERDEATGRSLGRRQEAQQNYHLDRAIESLLTKLGDRTVPTREIKDHFKSWRKRYGFDHREVLERAILLGLVVNEGAEWRRA